MSSSAAGQQYLPHLTTQSPNPIQIEDVGVGRGSPATSYVREIGIRRSEANVSMLTWLDTFDCGV